MSRSILVRGQEVACTARVRTWRETGLQFPPSKQRLTTSIVVNHWTGAENPPERLYENMRRAKLAVHFAIDALGTVWQFMDASERGAHCHASNANSYAVGIELINRGHAFDVPERGVSRPLRREVIHGTWITYSGFTDAQIMAALALNESLCRAYGLPMRVPMHPSGTVLSTAMSLADAQRFRGCVGHYQLERAKVDPGTGLLRLIHEHGGMMGLHA
jgi:N-acetyl-anhydromuramyl-L-alanine amidase AmpD